MGVCSSFMVKEWKTALAPYKIKDSFLAKFFMAASHGAVEALAKKWKIRNVAHANLLQHRSFPVLNVPSVNGDLPLRDRGLASGADHSVDEHTADTTMASVTYDPI